MGIEPSTFRRQFGIQSNRATAADFATVFKITMKKFIIRIASYSMQATHVARVWYQATCQATLENGITQFNGVITF